MEIECSLPVSFAGMWRENRTVNGPPDMLSDMKTQSPSQFARLSCGVTGEWDGGGLGGGARGGCHLQDGVPGTL